MTEAVLRGKSGSRRDVVLLNAGAALLVAGVVDTMEEGIERATLTIDAGLAADLLERLRAERRAAAAPGDAPIAEAATAGQATTPGQPNPAGQATTAVDAAGAGRPA